MQLARTNGDDPEALFPLAESAVAYRELRNGYMERQAAAVGEIAGARREVKAAKLLLAGGKTAYRREARRATTKAKRSARKQARRVEEAAEAAGAAAAAAVAAGGAPAPPPAPPRPRRAVPPRTAMQRLGRED